MRSSPSRWLYFLFWPVLGGLVAALLIIRFMPPAPAPDAPPVVAESATSAPAAAPPAGPIAPTQGPLSYAAAVEHATPAVVNIYTRKTVETPVNPMFADPRFRRFFGIDRVPMRKRMESSLGSGVIVDARGYVLTNHHVVAGADEIVVALRDGREAHATVVGTDPDTDLAVLRIQLAKLPVIVQRDSATLRIGDVVLAIGNPFGVGQTVTIGIVSAIGRSQLGINVFEDFIQTDAAINPGNSGGALVDANGELVGVNSAIFSQSGGYQGIGFAIPTRITKQVLADILAQGRVIRGWLGMDTQLITPQLAEALGLAAETDGVVVSSLRRDGPAHRAGILPGDLLLKLGDTPAHTPQEIIERVAALKPGKTVTLTVQRQGKVLSMRAAVEERPVNGASAP